MPQFDSRPSRIRHFILVFALWTIASNITAMTKSGLLAVLAYAEVFRLLTPNQWIWGVLAAVVFLYANGEVHRTYDNFSFVRLHQGKGVLVVNCRELLSHEVWLARGSYESGACAPNPPL